MAVKRIILTLDSEVEEKIRKKAKEQHYSTVQRYIYDLIRKDLLRDKKISAQNQQDSSNCFPTNKKSEVSDDIKSSPIKNRDYIDLSVESIAKKLNQDFPNLSSQFSSAQSLPPVQRGAEPKKKLPSELIMEQIEKEAQTQETIKKLKELGN
jgi:hypothetical protein